MFLDLLYLYQIIWVSAYIVKTPTIQHQGCLAKNDTPLIVPTANMWPSLWAKNWNVYSVSKVWLYHSDLNLEKYRSLAMRIVWFKKQIYSDLWLSVILYLNGFHSIDFKCFKIRFKGQYKKCINKYFYANLQYYLNLAPLLL